jgi:uncharacterized protein (UPF0305 family)
MTNTTKPDSIDQPTSATEAVSDDLARRLLEIDLEEQLDIYWVRRRASFLRRDARDQERRKRECLVDAMLLSIDSMTDAEIEAECIKDGESLQEVGDRVRRTILKAIDEHEKQEPT